MKSILKKLFVIQEVSNKNRRPQLGRGFSTAYRLNPYNPLSYITIVLTVIIGIIAFGFVGVWEQIDLKNPFKWN